MSRLHVEMRQLTVNTIVKVGHIIALRLRETRPGNYGMRWAVIVGTNWHQSFDVNDGLGKAAAAGPGSLHSGPRKASQSPVGSVHEVFRRDLRLRGWPAISSEIGPQDN